MWVSILNALNFMKVGNISYTFHTPIKMQSQQSRENLQHHCSIKVVYVPEVENYRINFL